MTIHRETNYIRFRAARETNASGAGDVLEAWRDAGGWHLYNPREGKSYLCFAAQIRSLAAEVLEQSKRDLSLSWRLAH